MALKALAKRTRIVIFLALIVLIGIAAYVLWPGKPPPPQWAETTKPYGAPCGAECDIVWDQTAGGHGGDAVIMHDPAVDDEIAQWSGCVGSVAGCVQQAELTTRAIAACIENADCPPECKDRFASEIDMTAEPAKALDLFETLFIEEGAYCVPA